MPVEDNNNSLLEPVEVVVEAVEMVLVVADILTKHRQLTRVNYSEEHSTP